MDKVWTYTVSNEHWSEDADGPNDWIPYSVFRTEEQAVAVAKVDLWERITDYGEASEEVRSRYPTPDSLWSAIVMKPDGFRGVHGSTEELEGVDRLYVSILPINVVEDGE